MEDGTKFNVKCPVCGKMLSEMGILDGRLYYECLWGTSILKTRFEPEHQTKRRLMRGLSALSEEVSRYGHSQQNGVWSKSLVWQDVPGDVAGDQFARVFLSFRYCLAGDKLLPLSKKDAPSVRLPEEAFQTGDWEWKGKAKDLKPLEEEDLKRNMKVGRKKRR